MSSIHVKNSAENADNGPRVSDYSLYMALVIAVTVTIYLASLTVIVIQGESTEIAYECDNVVTCKLVEDNIDSSVAKIVDVFENRLCRMNIKELYAKGLTHNNIPKIKEFCSLPREAKIKIIYAKITGVRNAIIKSIFNSSNSKCITKDAALIGASSTTTCPSLGACSSGNNVYSCGIIPRAYNIPCPRVLNITICHVINMPTDCCIPGKVECLWGCENEDPVLGFGPTGKPFNSLQEFRNYVESRGYYESIFSYPERGIYAFTRDIGYGYRYEAWYHDGRKMGYSEGPEPNPDPNWYGYINGFWPWYVYWWHNKC
ncbi:MAG: hypothetical protein QW320_02465 [Ignisphaera sp.]